MLCIRGSLQIQRHRLEVKECRTLCHENGNVFFKKAGVTMLIPDKTDFKLRL